MMCIVVALDATAIAATVPKLSRNLCFADVSVNNSRDEAYEQRDDEKRLAYMPILRDQVYTRLAAVGAGDITQPYGYRGDQ